MPAPALKLALAQADGDLEEIAAQASFLSSTSKIVAASGPLIAFVQPDGALRALMADFRKNQIDDINLLYQGLYVQILASYEVFVRRLIAEFVEAVGRQEKTFAALERRSGFVDRHIYHTGVALQQVFENRTNVALDFSSLAKNLASVSAASDVIVLNSVAFTLQLSSLSSEGLVKGLRRIGVDQEAIWDDLAKEKLFQDFFGSKKTRDVAKRIQTALNEMVKRRNHIVHKGDAIQAISEADIREAVSFFKALHLGLALAVSASL